MTAKIIGIEKDRLSLSLKALKQDPWQSIDGRYQKDQVIEGMVTKINPFGAFIQLDKDIHGLVHISDFGSSEKMNSEIVAGKKYQFKIVSIEPPVHKMALSLVRPESAKKTEATQEVAPEADTPSSL